MTEARANRSSILASSLPAPRHSSWICHSLSFRFVCFLLLLLHQPSSLPSLPWLCSFFFFQQISSSSSHHYYTLLLFVPPCLRRCAKVRPHLQRAAHSCNYTCPVLFEELCFMLSVQTHISVTPLYFKISLSTLCHSCLIFHLCNEEVDLVFAFLKNCEQLKPSRC